MDEQSQMTDWSKLQELMAGKILSSWTERINDVSESVTPLSILSRLKHALRDGLLIRREFYTERNLEQSFGAGKVHWRTDKEDTKRQRIYLSEFGEIFQPVRVGSNVFREPDVSLQRLVKDDNRCAALVELQLMPGMAESLTFEEIEGAIGKGESEPLQFVVPGMKIKAAVDRHGNKRIRYRLSSALYKHRGAMWLTFDERGKLHRLLIFDEESQSNG
jgi:hypothetical protein